MTVSVCVGSSCHLKGSRDVVIRLQELIEEYKLSGEVELSASFCMGNCAKGVSVLLNGELLPYVTKDNVDEVFKEKILNPLRG